MLIENLTDEPLAITVDGVTEVVLVGDFIIAHGDAESTISVEVYDEDEQDVEMGHEKFDVPEEG